MQITFDTNEALSDSDKQILNFLLNDTAPKAPAKKAAAKKTTAAMATDAERAEAPAPTAAAVPDPAPMEPDQDLMAAAKARASALLGSGAEGKQRVMDALATAGADKVSNVTAEKLPAFIQSLND